MQSGLLEVQGLACAAAHLFCGLLPCPTRHSARCCCPSQLRRLHFCDAATQRAYFARQFELARSSGLPMFLHLRAAAADFLDIVQQHAGGLGCAGLGQVVIAVAA